MAWRKGLFKEIAEPSNYIISSDVAVVIADKYPKARLHYLVIPKDNIPSIFELRKSHLPLLEELHLLALNIIQVNGENRENFQIGFHAQPSMQQLHLHVISKDFVSDRLKTKKHWNSFNTGLFTPYEVIYNRLASEGCIRCLSKPQIAALLATPLKCNQCEFVANFVPDLKGHLLEHIK